MSWAIGSSDATGARGAFRKKLSADSKEAYNWKYIDAVGNEWLRPLVLPLSGCGCTTPPAAVHSRNHVTGDYQRLGGKKRWTQKEHRYQ
jgi:hypothetical protein